LAIWNRDAIKSSEPSNSGGGSNRSDANNSRDASNSIHDSKSRNAIIIKNAREKGSSATVTATEGKQSTARKKTTAGLQGRQHQQIPGNSRVDSSNENNTRSRTSATANKAPATTGMSW
jgi:hypothetical protein